MTVLLERERELGELKAALEEVVAGRGSAVGIEASAGLGKTRLLQEAREAGAGVGLNVLSGRATELERDFPFALVRQLLESEIASLPLGEREGVLEGATAAGGALGLDPDEDRDHDAFAVLHALYWVTAALAERKPLLLAIDDAHIADAGSLDYLGFLLPRLEELPVLLVTTGRPDEPDPSGGFRRLMTDSGVRHLTPLPLSSEAATILLAQELDHEPAPPFAAACFEVSGGNPFLLRELARTLAQRDIDPLPEHAEQVRGLVPERVAQTVSMRLERLPPSAGAAARALAILGEESDLRLVAELAEIDPAEAAGAADELRASAILDGGGALRFVHPLVRSAIYESVPVGERMAAHTLAAKLLREANSSPERVATQLLAGEARGDLATVETLLEAGEGAIASGALRSAIAYLTRALREPAPGELRPAVLEPLMVACYRTADQDTFAAIEADIDAELERDPSLRNRWAVPLTMALALSGRFEDGTAVLRDALELAVGQGDAERSLILSSQHNTLATIAGSIPLLDLGRYADQIDPDSPAGRLAAVNEARAATMRGRPEEAADAARRALGRDAVIFADETEVTAAVGVVLALLAADELALARYAVERALVIAREQGATASLMRASMLGGMVGWGEGDLVRAEPDVRQGAELTRSLAPLVLSITPILMEILIERDELEASERALEATGVGDGPMPESPIFIMMLYARGHLRVARGEFNLAVEDFKALPVEKKGAWDFGSLTASFAAPLAAQALRAVGDGQGGRELAESMEPLARRWDRPSTVAHMLRTRAAVQNGDESIDDLEKAAAVLAGSPRRLERAHALLDLGEALRRVGRRSDARGPLREALELGRRCGAVRVARQASGELQASGEKVRRYTPIGVESLTPSERRVAELAASGMTNRQIAQSLFVTVKTVEAHLSAAYDKLDIDSRRQLPAALASQERA